MRKMFLFVIVIFVTILAPNHLLANQDNAACAKADLNQDQIVDLSDYSIFVANFLQSPALNQNADLNNDGLVDLSDYSVFVTQFMSQCDEVTPSHNLRVMTISFNPAFGDTTIADQYFTNQRFATAKEIENYTWQIAKEDYQKVTNNTFNVDVVHHLEVSQNYVYPDGFSFDLDTFGQCVWGRPGFDPQACDYRKSQFNYVKWFQDNQICQIAAANDVDELWIMSPPYLMAWESFMVGPENGFLVNGPDYIVPECTKHLVVINPVYDTPDNFMHNVGHRVEATMVYLTKNWQAEDKFKYWDNFSAHHINRNIASPDFIHCGNDHFPHNATRGYDYDNMTVAPSNCVDWNSIPEFTNTTEEINCQAWGCKDRGWQVFWLSHMPHKQGSLSLTSRTGKEFEIPLNWWTFILNPQLAMELRQSSE